MEKILNFTVIPLRMTYPKQALKLSFDPFDEDEDLEDEIDSFKIYACESPDGYVKKSTYGSVSILGNLPDLSIGVEHKVKAIEEYKNGNFQYKILNIKRDKPIGDLSVRLFLSEFCTSRQVEELMREYPNIINMVINNEADSIDTKKLHGIGDYIINVIKRKILENFVYAELVDTFKGFLDFKTVKALYKLYPSVEQVKAHIALEPYKTLCKLSRVGFKTADKMLLEFDKKCRKMHESGEEPPILFDFELITSYQRMESCVSFILAQNEQDGNTKMKKSQLQRESKNLASQCMSHFGDVLKTSNEFVVVEEWVAIKDTYDAEKYIAEKLIEAISDNDEKWDVDIEKYRNSEDGTELTDQQMQMLQNAVDYKVSICNGFAGSGKTKSTSVLIRLLKDNKKHIALCAPTGRAAKVASNYSSEYAMTIHRMLGSDGFQFAFNEQIPLHADVVLVDEFSMVDVFLFKELISAIDFNTTRLVIVGDSAQIPSVGCGNCLHDLLQSGKIPTTTLDRIFRFGKGGIDTVSKKTRECTEYLEDKSGMQVIGEDKGYVFIPSSTQQTVKMVCDLYSKLLSKGEKPENIAILSAYNKGDQGATAINNLIQPIANPLSKTSTSFIEFGGVKYFKNDLIMQTQNNYKAIKFFNVGFDLIDSAKESMKIGEKTFISNGDVGKILEVVEKYIVIQFGDDVVLYNKSNLETCRLSYSYTMHKSQGGQCPIIINIVPKSHQFMLNSNLMYVATTRAKIRVYEIGDINTINSSLKKKANLQRNTCLCDMIKNKENNKIG